MRVQTIVEGHLIDMEDDQEITIEAEMEDTVEDIIVKATFSFSNLQVNKVSVYYGGRLQDKSLLFHQIKYHPSKYIYLKGKKDVCSNCEIF